MQKIIPNDVMLPPARLQALVGQAVRIQMAGSAAYDNDPSARPSLCSDWTCSLRTLPTSPVQTLHNHQAQVWAAQFSSDGKRVITGGQNGSVCIWNVRSSLWFCVCFMRSLILRRRVCVHQSLQLECAQVALSSQTLLACNADSWLRNR